MRISVLGAIALSGDFQVEPDLSPSLRQLLAVLVAAGERGMPQDSIAEEVWGDDLPPTWESAFRNGVTRLRSKLGKQALIATSGRYRLNSEFVEVDAWSLLAISDFQAVSDSDLVGYLGGVPFSGVEFSPAIRSMADVIDAARLKLIRERALDHRDPLDVGTLAVLRSYQRMHAFDEELLELAVRAHLSAGETSRALAVIVDARREAEAASFPTSQRLIALEEAIRVHRAPGPLLARSAGAAKAPQVPHQLAGQLGVPEVGRASELHQLLDAAAASSCALVVGNSGTGKTRLLASAASHLVQAGHTVRYASAQNHPDVAYGTIVAALPQANASLKSILSTTADPDLAHRRACVALAELLEDGGEQVCLVIDDAHMLDSHSERFLLYLLDRPSSSTMTVILSGRSDDTSEGWLKLRPSLLQLGVPSVQVNPLGRLELLALARTIHPDAHRSLLERVVTEVIVTTGGLPGIARYVLSRADGETLLFEEGHAPTPASGDPLVSYATTFETRAKMVGIVGAVLGHTFELAEVVALSTLAENDVVLGCEQLVADGFLRESQVLDRFSFVHALHRSAMLAAASRARLRRLHREAAVLATSRKRKAKHLAAAVPLVDQQRASLALVDAAEEYFEEGAWREAATALRDAYHHCSASLTVLDLARFAAALDHSGADGSLIRERAVERARVDQDWSAGLQAAVSGLPSAEQIRGDAKRVQLLESLPVDKLDRRNRFLLATTLVRQLMFLGREEDASAWSCRAQTEATTADERVLAFVSAALTGSTDDPSLPLDLPSDFHAVRNRLTALRGLQISALSHLERSSAAVADSLVRALRSMTHEVGDPHRTWHLMVLDALRTVVDGDWESAERIADDAMDHGYKFGIRDAETAHVGQLFSRHWLRGDLELLTADLDRFEAAGPSLFNRMMCAMILQAQGGSRAHELCTVVEACVVSKNLFAVPSLVLAAEQIAILGDARLASDVEARLLPLSGTSSIAGIGVIHAGPVDRALAFLAKHSEVRLARFHRAKDVADRQQLRLWQVVCRLDIAHAEKASTDQAATFATTSALQTLLTRSPS